MFNMHIMPRETGSAFDPNVTMVGSGPFIWDEFVQDVSFKVVRNPEWFNGPDVPYLDAVHELAIEPLTALTQFQAGGIDLLNMPTPDFVPAPGQTLSRGPYRASQGARLRVHGVR